jgi:hypothetical protein
VLETPHNTCPILFLLVVDDFGVNYVGKQHANHLCNALKENYEDACGWEGNLYCGVTLDWNYQQRPRRGPVLGGPLRDILVLDVRSVGLYQDVQ